MALDNRTVHVREDQRSTSYDLGSLVGEPVRADLDKGRLDVTASDLAIASSGSASGPDAHLLTTRLSSSCFAPGWWFSFQRSLALGALPHKVGYTNEAGRTCTFAWQSATSTWLAPNGLVATLAQNGNTWTLTRKDRTVLTFNSAGELTSESDANGSTVTYSWMGSNMTRSRPPTASRSTSPTRGRSSPRRPMLLPPARARSTTALLRPGR